MFNYLKSFFYPEPKPAEAKTTHPNLTINTDLASLSELIITPQSPISPLSIDKTTTCPPSTPEVADVVSKHSIKYHSGIFAKDDFFKLPRTQQKQFKKCKLEREKVIDQFQKQHAIGLSK